MAKNYNAATEAALAAGKVSFRYLAQLDLDDGVYRFGNHTPGELLSALGQSWYGVGQLATLPDLVTSTGVAADEATIKLNGTMVMQPPPQYVSVTSWFRDILTRDMLNRRCSIYEVILQVDTGSVLYTDPMFAGPIDRTPLNTETPELSIRVRSNRQALAWPNGRSRSDADQRRINADDGSLRHVGNVAARRGKMPWGFIPKDGGQRNGRGGGGGGSGSGFIDNFGGGRLNIR